MDRVILMSSIQLLNGEADLQSSKYENENSESKNTTVVARQLSWNPTTLFLGLSTFQGLRFREYRLLCAGFVFLAMGLWMDQVTVDG